MTLKNIVVIGGGHLGGAIARGLAQGGASVSVVDRNAHKREALLAKGIKAAFADVSELPSGVELCVLAVKPTVTAEMGRRVSALNPHVMMSVAAGVTLSALKAAAGENATVVRAMMNTAVAVGRGTTILCGERLGAALLARLSETLKPLGAVVALHDEKQMDAATAVSACAPAYFLLALEGLADGGVRMGLDRKTAESLALGALDAAVGLGGADAFEAARHAIVSPGGMTAQGMIVLERAAVRATFSDATAASTAHAQARLKAAAPPDEREKS